MTPPLRVSRDFCLTSCQHLFPFSAGWSALHPSVSSPRVGEEEAHQVYRYCEKKSPSVDSSLDLLSADQHK